MSTEDSEIVAHHVLEDGEIEDSDVEEGIYVPLARPDNFNPPSLINMQIQDEGSDSPETDSDSGSDSDSALRSLRPKRTKIKPRRLQPQPELIKKKKYDIWCAAVQEQVLTEDMVGCDVTKSRRTDYGVESYDYTIKYKLDDNSSAPAEKCGDETFSNFSTNKRTHTDRKSVKHRLGKRQNSNQEMIEKEPRLLPNLAVTENDLLEDVAREIADSLREEKKDLLLRIVETIGPGKAIELYQETKKVEEDGGILVMNGYRRRTAGGVYIFLLKRASWASQEMQKRIFSEERGCSKRERRRAHAAQRNQRVQQLKQKLDSELPALVSRAEAMAQRENGEHGSNPPPSPATDARECSSDTDGCLDAEAPHPSREDSAAVTGDRGARMELPGAPDAEARPMRSEVPADYDDDFLEVNCTDDMDLF